MGSKSNPTVYRRFYFRSAECIIAGTLILIFAVRCGGGTVIAQTCTRRFEECVCDIRTAIHNLKSYAYFSKEAKLEERIRIHTCQLYNNLPDSLLIDASESGSLFDTPDEPYSPENRRRYYDRRYKSRFRRRKRQINLGVPSNEVFEEAVAHLQPNSFHQYIIFGSKVTFQCSGTQDELDGSRVRKMSWTHYNGDPVTSSQVSIDAIAGTLTIPTVQLTDSDIYNCSLELSMEEGGLESRVYSHQLSVVSEPIFWLKTSVEYGTERCNHQELNLIRSKLRLWVEDYVCPMCEVHNDTVRCGSSSISEEFPFTYHIHLVVSAIGLEIRMPTPLQVERYTTCTVSCFELMHAKILELVRNSLLTVFRLPIEVKGNGNNKLRHDPVQDSFQIELLMGCLAGFFLQFKLCFPCFPGSFSYYGSTECFPCPMGSYQHQPGQASCIPCVDGQDTLDQGSVSPSHCHYQMVAESAKVATELYHSNTVLFMVSGILGGIGLLLLIGLTIACTCCPESGFGQYMRKCCCCCCSPKGYESLRPEADVEPSTKARRPSKARPEKTSKTNGAKEVRGHLMSKNVVPLQEEVGSFHKRASVSSKASGNRASQGRRSAQIQSSRRSPGPPDTTINLSGTGKDIESVARLSPDHFIPKPPPLPPLLWKS